jgi:hypothetical protein
VFFITTRKKSKFDVFHPEVFQPIHTRQAFTQPKKSSTTIPLITTPPPQPSTPLSALLTSLVSPYKLYTCDKNILILSLTGRASLARQVKGDDPDKKGYPGTPGWGFGVGLTTPHSKKTYFYESRTKEKA